MLQAGTVFAGYQVLRQIGSGGMGDVYLAQHPRLSRRDALKVLSAELSADREFADRFRREANLAASLWHPNIVGVHDAGESEGRLWLTMDYVEGVDALDILREHPNGVALSDVCDIVDAVAEALDFSHSKRLLHRDVKPGNILISGDVINRRILLADFGIARPFDDVDGLTATNMTLGTFKYSPPEQLMGGELDGRSDQYALAATAQHLLTGVPVFDHNNAAVVISQHLNGSPPPVSRSNTQFAPLDHVFARALAKDKSQRFTTCREFAQYLRSTSACEQTMLAATPVFGQRKSRNDSPAPTPHRTSSSGSEPIEPSGLSTPMTRTQGRKQTRILVGASIAFIVTITIAVGVNISFKGESAKESESNTLSTSPARKDPAIPIPAIALPPAISAAGKITVATNTPYAPAEFNAADGTLTGFEVDLMNALAANLGLIVEFREMEFSKIIPAVVAGEVDLGMAAFTDSKQRENYVDMINYFAAGTRWAQRADRPQVDPESACGLRVSVQATTVQETDELPARSRACSNAGQPGITIVPFDSQDAATNAVALGQADAMSADSPVTDYTISRSQGILVASGAMFDVAPYGLPISKNSELTQSILQGLQEMINSGRYRQILARWGVEDGGIDEATVNKAVG